MSEMMSEDYFTKMLCVALGSFFSRRVEVLTGSVNDPADPDLVASTCYAAAVIYAIFVAFCGVQV